MACDISGGCKVCPGMWIAGVLLLAMIIQSWFVRAPASPQVSSADTTGVVELKPQAEQPTQK